MEVKLDGLEAMGRRLRALPVELGSKGGGPLRSALFQMAKVVRDEARLRAPRDEGILKEHIVATRHRNPQAIGATEYYGIGMKGGTRTGGRRGSKASRVIRAAAAAHGRFVELGTSQMKAQPFLRPAIETAMGPALSVFTQAFAKALDRAEKKLAGMR